MEEPTSLPTRAELQKLLGTLIFDDEIDDLSASIILERSGVNLEKSLEHLKARLENTMGEMKESGEEVPQGLIEALRILQPQTESAKNDNAGPDETIDALLKGRILGANTDPKTADHIQAFRPNETEFLTEEDLKILDDISKELRSQSKDG